MSELGHYRTQHRSLSNDCLVPVRPSRFKAAILSEANGITGQLSSP